MDQTTQENKPDWNISELYSKAWQVVKKNKILWVLGAASAVGSSYNFRSSNFNSADFQKLFNQNPATQHAPQKLTEVLGASTNKPFTDSIFHILTSVPMSLYVIGVVELAAILFLGLIISLVYRAWTQGMMIKATDHALKDQKINLEDITREILPIIKPLIWLNIVPGLVFTLAILITIIVLTFAIALVPFPIKILPILIAVAALGATIYWAILLAVSLLWAPREIVLNHKKGKESLMAGFKIGKKKFWASLALGLVNNILSIVMFLVPVAILGALIIGGVFSAIKSPSTIPFLVGAAIISGLPVIFGLTLLGGIIESFKATVWTDAYSKIKGKYDH